MTTNTAPIIKWLKYNRVRYKVTWEEIEDHLSWEEDSISGVDFDTFTYSQLTSMKYALIELVKEKHDIQLPRVDV